VRRPSRRRQGAATPGRGPRGFTLIELLVVVTIIMVLVGLLSAAIFSVKRSTLVKAAKFDLKTFSMALAQYRRELGRYPPDSGASTDIPDAPVGWTDSNAMNEVLVYYLGSKLQRGANYYGPYMEFKKGRLKDTDGDGLHEYQDPFGGIYSYAENASELSEVGMNPRGYDLVSPGPDGELGGTMDPANGYESPEPIEAAEEDNIANFSIGS
jgi:type II secretory pathway pseudopilin PulG